MPTLSFKIASPIVVAGLFIMVSFVALNYNAFNASSYIILGFLTVYVFLFGFAIGQNFTVPIRKLIDRLDGLVKGDLKSRFYSESKDELGQLANMFNKVADRLEESNTENERTKRSVGIKVEAETQSLKEMITALEQKVQNRSLELQRVMAELERSHINLKTKEREAVALKNELMALRGNPKKKSPKKIKEEIDANEEKLSGQSSEPELPAGQEEPVKEDQPPN